MNVQAKTETPMVLQDVVISLNDQPLLSINETIRPGEVLTVMGPSGSGKSSLLAFIGGFLDPVFSASGKLFLGKKEITDLQPEQRGVGLLFQDALLFPHMSVGQNLAFALPDTAMSKSDRMKRVEETLDAAGLSGMRDRDPDTLSGGQKSRIALMRVLLAEPSALLLDEPFSKLDANLRAQIREFVFGEAKKRKLPVLLVTHDLQDAKAAEGKIIRLEQ